MRGAVEVSSKILDCADVRTCGMLSVITPLEFFQHHFAKMGHRNTSCDPHLHQAIEHPMLATSREASAAGRLRQNAFTRTYSIVPFANPRSEQWRPLNWGKGRPECSCVEPLRLLVWRRCRRLCPNNSAGPLRLFTDRNPAGFWRRWCVSSEIWISPKRPCMRHSPSLWSPGLRLVFRTSRAPG